MAADEKTPRLIMYQPPGQPSDPPTWADIERLSLSYPIIYHAVTLVARGDLTREEALILVVFALADSFQKLFNAELDRKMTETGETLRYLTEVVENFKAKR